MKNIEELSCFQAAKNSFFCSLHPFRFPLLVEDNQDLISNCSSQKVRDDPQFGRFSYLVVFLIVQCERSGPILDSIYPTYV